MTCQDCGAEIKIRKVFTKHPYHPMYWSSDCLCRSAWGDTETAAEYNRANTERISTNIFYEMKEWPRDYEKRVRMKLKSLGFVAAL